MSTQTQEIIKLDTAEFGIEKSKAEQMEAAFVPMINRLKEMETEYDPIIAKAKEGIDTEVAAEAKKLRLQYVKGRTSVDAIHKVGKQEALLLGRAWDGLKNQYLYITNQKEEELKKIENHFELIEAERKEALRIERENAVEPYEADVEHISLGEMSEDVWENYFNGVKVSHEQKVAAELKAEEDKIAVEQAATDERARIQEENERLQKEAEEKEKALQAEREKAEAERKALEEKTQLEAEAKEKELSEERAKAEAERQKLEAEREAERKVAEEAAHKEAEEKAKIEAELQAKRDAEAKAEADKKVAIEAELSKGDKEKFKDLLDSLTALKTKYEFKSDEYKLEQEGVNNLIDKIIRFYQNNQSNQ